MTKLFARRSALVLVLAGFSFAVTAPARADGVTGTDPCPKGMLCSTSASPTSSPAGAGSASTAMGQVLLAMLGLA